MIPGMVASREACEWSGIPAEGVLPWPTRPPSREISQWHGSRLSRTGFRSHHGCGAAGVSHPSSSLPSVKICCVTSSTEAPGVSTK
jgi:hypothetical protein